MHFLRFLDRYLVKIKYNLTEIFVVSKNLCAIHHSMAKYFFFTNVIYLVDFTNFFGLEYFALI